MHPDLYLVAYRADEQDLLRRVERRRVMSERSGDGERTAAHRRRATLRFASGQPLRRAALAIEGLRARAGVVLARSARRLDGTSAGEVCCSPA